MDCRIAGLSFKMIPFPFPARSGLLSLSVPKNEMSVSRSFRCLARHQGSNAILNGSKFARYRNLATAAAGSPTLPLAGVRVLDMTRVLAGVRSIDLFASPY